MNSSLLLKLYLKCLGETKINVLPIVVPIIMIRKSYLSQGINCQATILDKSYFRVGILRKGKLIFDPIGNEYVLEDSLMLGSKCGLRFDEHTYGVDWWITDFTEIK